MRILSLQQDSTVKAQSMRPPGISKYSDLLSAIHRTVNLIIASGTWMGEYVIQWCWTLASSIELEKSAVRIIT
ncbi:uncharacterized protein IAS62_000423 [Cryptococcus decagattii]|uniref:Uncharacterized protein n=1 Tax=Cryptococcus decagattii TaxID=1859122 RepID=A0ABZ2AKS7_9TREE